MYMKIYFHKNFGMTNKGLKETKWAVKRVKRNKKGSKTGWISHKGKKESHLVPKERINPQPPLSKYAAHTAKQEYMWIHAYSVDTGIL